MDIPKKFLFGGECYMVARNVGELIDLLSELPKNLSIRQNALDLDNGASLVIFNIKSTEPFLEFRERDY